MFRRLRNRFIITAMSLLSAVLLLSFGAIYTSTAMRLQHIPEEPTMRDSPRSFNQVEVRDYLAQRRQADARQTLESLIMTLILTGLVTLAVGFFISYLLAERAIEPVRRAYEAQKEFIAHASHELKTPLAVIDANIEAEIAGKKRASKWLINIQDETARMEKLIKNLLTLARLESSQTTLALSEFDVSATVRSIIEKMKPVIEKKKLQLTLDIEDNIMLRGEKNTIEQISMILLDNAIKYTHAGGHVNISMTPMRDQVCLTIENTYPPIDKNKFANIFDRFYQVDESQHGEGYGLGLSIADIAAKRIGADVSLYQRDNMVVATLLLKNE